MPIITLVERTAEIKQSAIKKFASDELYKKCGFKTAADFAEVHTWRVTYKGATRQVTLYGKTTGKAGMENKYDFPPPADNVLLFGTCCLVMKSANGETVEDLTIDVWEKIHETLFGGFENLADTEDADEKDDDDDDDDVPKEKKTATGYEKDGFVISDNDSVESDGAEEEDDDDEGGDDDTDDAGDDEADDIDIDDDEPDVEVEVEDEPDVESEPESEDDDEDEDARPKKRKTSAAATAAKKTGAKGTAAAAKGSKGKGKGKSSTSDDVLHFESNELELEPYVDTDDEA